MDAAEGRRRGAWFGLAVGDALGAPVEFQDAESIRRRHGRVTEMMAGGPWLAGEWTDDTALALANAAAYSGGGFDLTKTAAEMVRWLATGPKDVGNLSAQAIRRLARGEDPSTVGAALLVGNSRAAGNGSLMRAAATALARRPEDPRLAIEAAALSAVTHADPRCVDACVLYCGILSRLVHDGATPMAAMRDSLHSTQGPLDPDVRAITEAVLAGEGPRHAGDPIGFVLLAYERALLTLRDAEDIESALVEVVGLGGDTDTNAAIAGALLGGRFGEDAIPLRWRAALREREVLEAAYAALPT